MEPTSPSGSTDWGITLTLRWSSQNRKTNCRPTGPNTTDEGAERSAGNAVDPSAEAVSASCSISAGGAADESASCSISAGGAADESASCSISAGATVTKPAHYPIATGLATTEVASGEGRCSSTSLQWRCSYHQTTCPGMWMATNQGMWSQGQISQSPQAWMRVSCWHHHNYHHWRCPALARTLRKDQALQPCPAGHQVSQQWLAKIP